jgi:hypothetical protein
MSRYYFHLTLPKAPRDKVGQELENVQAAKCAAVQLIADRLCSHPQAFWDADAHRVEVANESGLMLFAIDLFTTTSPIIASAIRRRGPKT